MKTLKHILSRVGLPVLSILLMTGVSSCELVKKYTGLGGKKESQYKVNTLPTDRESVIQQASNKAYTSKDVAKGVIRGDWAITEVLGKKAHGEKSPFLKFIEETHQVYGNNGCNTLNATYTYNPADTTLRFSNVITTMMACGEEGITDIEINQALDATRYYSWKLNGSEYWLYFFDASHHKVMTLMHQNFEFLNGAWQVTAINGEAINIPEMKLVIDVDGGKVHGNTGCNILNGEFTTDMDAANSISFQALATTRKMCGPDSRETDLLVALEDAAFAQPVSPTRAVLLDNRHNVVLRLDKINLKK